VRLVRRIEVPMRVTIGDWPVRDPAAVEAFPELREKTRTPFGDPPPMLVLQLGLRNRASTRSVPHRRDLAKIDHLLFVVQQPVSGPEVIVANANFGSCGEVSGVKSKILCATRI
jgi:hypothetical protein